MQKYQKRNKDESDRIYIGTVDIADDIYNNSFANSNIYAIKTDTECFLVETEDKKYSGLIMIYEHEWYKPFIEHNSISFHQMYLIGDWLSEKDQFQPHKTRWNVLEESYRKLNNISDNVQKSEMPNYRDFVPTEQDYDEDNHVIRNYERFFTKREKNISLYKSKNGKKSIEAVQWDGRNIKWVIDICNIGTEIFTKQMDDKPYLCNELFLHIPSTLFTKEKTINGIIGDYIVRERTGKIYFMKPEEFESKFKKI